MEDTAMHREPFVKLMPVFKDYLWGGNKLKALYGAKEQRVAEAWLLSVHPDGPSIIAEGPYAGLPFPDYLQAEGMREAFPVLIKLIDAAQKLSVQVHPDDEYARIHENDHGKNEMWIILEADPAAYLYIGFSRDVRQDELRARIADGTVEAVLNKVPTHAGDIYYIPAGTVHAIGEGNLILEVQQSSNATYRLYDYQRRDAYGNLRPLHLSKALDVLHSGKAAQAGQAQTGGGMACPYFSVERLAVSGAAAITMSGDRMAAAVCVSGNGTLARLGQTTRLQKGDSVYLPAGPA
ncbi:MAG: class I mannose-6-phosphate isomerase, partial [Firmicutes bacterium]|nr:class I mannose-6-phosphate isomerase [Bacillota bacterium]